MPTNAIFAFIALLAAAPAVAEPVALIADRVIDGVSDRARANTVVVVDGERILAVGDRSVIPSGARVIDLPGRTLMPGFINCENRLHYVRDVSFREDHCRVRHQPGTLARLRTIAHNIIQHNHLPNTAEAIFKNALSFDHLIGLKGL